MKKDISESEPYIILRDEDGEVIVPDSNKDKQDFLETLWNKIFGDNEISFINLYNIVAEDYNRKLGTNVMVIINSQTKSKIMAEKKAAVKKKAAPKKVVTPVKDITAKKVVTKKPAATKKVVEAPVKKLPVIEGEITSKKKPVVEKKPAAVKKVPTDKKETQKEIISRLASEGMTIDQVVESSGIQKSNVSYYFSKLKLNKKK